MSRNEKLNFDESILKSINGSEYVDNHYFDDSYKNALRLELSERFLLEKFEKLEIPDLKKKPHMCSVASSSRLCFLYFANVKDIEFEKKLSIGIRGGNPQLDAYSSTSHTYYECKCHEIFDNHNTNKNHLSKSYAKIISEKFNVNITNSNVDDYLKLALKDFGINDDSSIYDLRFDFKQFICHLLGIANEGGGTLKYVFFTPSEKMKKNFDDIYKKLNTEIKEIKASQKIRKMCEENNIKIDFTYKSVDTVEDFVLKRIRDK